MGSLKLHFMEIFGIHVGISRITLSKHNFRGLSRLFRSLSITFRLVDGQKLQRLSWNEWKSVFSRGRSFSHFIFTIFAFSRPVFSNKGFPWSWTWTRTQQLRIIKGYWSALQRKGSTEPKSLRNDPSKFAPKTFVCTRSSLYVDHRRSLCLVLALRTWPRIRACSM